jgi:Arc/MetJ-type ribon-helix-helix transcriptional regulator
MTRRAENVKKIAVSLPPDLVEHGRRAVASGQAASFSSYVADAMAAVARRDALSAAIADYEAEFGEITPAELEDTTFAQELNKATAPRRPRSSSKKPRSKAS